ncbi:uncharacterized protein PRCAT00003605001 [Priceomyces carsonii]|uniref:uncharacterized protein n=1 Tax=Priceomyces carsonii TaxID=28549 RepID=UPI002ED9F7C7|nr:unnamed protein product [Priceomyces carsonii]
MSSNRKHGRSSDDEFSIGLKKIKLDYLLDNLKLCDDNEENNTSASDQLNVYDINPNIKSYSVIKTTDDSSTSLPNITSYIALKLVSHYENTIKSNLSLIPWYNYKFLVAYKFQRWLLRMFNKFLRKYCKRNHSKYKPLRLFDKMMNLISQNKLSFQDLLKIAIKENDIELRNLRHKYELKEVSEEDIEDESGTLANVKYNYWDNLKFDKELDMLDSDCSEPESKQNSNETLNIPKIIEISDDDDDDVSDVEMEIDSTSSSYNSSKFLNESKYGSYYNAHRDL